MMQKRHFVFGIIVLIVCSCLSCAVYRTLSMTTTTMIDWVLASNIMDDITSAITGLGMVGAFLGVGIWMSDDIPLRKIIQGYLVMMVVISFLSFLGTLSNMPKLVVRSNIQRVKMKCFDLESTKDINIIIKRLEGAEAID